jgi:hypothetical protein
LDVFAKKELKLLLAQEGRISRMDSLSFHSASDLAGGGGGGGGGGFDQPTEKPGHFKLVSKGFSPFYLFKLLCLFILAILGHLVAGCSDGVLFRRSR